MKEKRFYYLVTLPENREIFLVLWVKKTRILPIVTSLQNRKVYYTI